MGDVFVERMIKRKMTGVDYALVAGILVAALLLSVVSFVVGTLMFGNPMVTLLVTAGAIFGAYKLIGTRLLEYEYSITNGFVAVDKIINRSSRKRMTAFECDTCEDIGRYPEQEERLKQRSFDQRIFATQYTDRRDSWYMIVQSKKTGKTLVIFNPDEEFLDAVKRFIPRPLRFEKFGRN